MHFFLHCLALCTYKEICCCAPLYVKYFHPAFSSNTVTDKHPLCCSTTKLHVLPLLVIVKTFILTRIPFPFMYHTTAHSISSLYFKILINSIEDLSQALNTCLQDIIILDLSTCSLDCFVRVKVWRLVCLRVSELTPAISVHSYI